MWRSLAMTVITLVSIATAKAQSNIEMQALLDLLENTTNLPVAIHGHLPVSTGEDWLTWAELDRQRLQNSLLARGYLEAEVTVLPLESAGQETLRNIDVRVAPGQLYVITDVHLTGISDTALLDELTDVAATIIGQPAQAAIGDALADRLVWTLGQNGYALPVVKVERFRPKPGSTQATVEVSVNPGHLSYFTAVNLSRVESADLLWVSSRVPFKPGTLFSIDALSRFREELLDGENVEQARVDVLMTGPAEFSLQVRFQRAYQAPQRTPQVEFGASLLAAVLIVIGLRQTLAADRTRYANTALIDVTAATMITVAAAMVGLRAATFLQ